MKRKFWAAFWLAIYVALVISPLAIIWLGPRPADTLRPMQREFLRELSVALGFVGLAMMGLQFAHTARLPFWSNVFDMDSLYAFHHAISLISFGFVLAHPLLLFINNPHTLILLNVAIAPWRARAAVAAVVLMIALILLSVWRKQLEFEYDHWHLWHELLSIAVAGLALYHMFKIDYYTSVPAQRILWIAFACLWGAMAAYARLFRPWMMLKRPYRVAELIEERGDAWTLALEPDGHRGLTFLPGQFAWLNLWKLPFALVYHPFSFASSAERTGRIEFTIKVQGDWTRRVKEVQVGQRVHVDGPYGAFSTDVHRAPGYVFIAGGIGSAPILSILRTLADRGDERPLIFFYGSPRWEDVIYRQELDALAGRLNLRLVHALERPPDGWQGETGFINAPMLDRHLGPDRADYAYFICGPLPMIHSVERALRQLGIPRTKVHAEKYQMA